MVLVVSLFLLCVGASVLFAYINITIIKSKPTKEDHPALLFLCAINLLYIVGGVISGLNIVRHFI